MNIDSQYHLHVIVDLFLIKLPARVSEDPPWFWGRRTQYSKVRVDSVQSFRRRHRTELIVNDVY
jgi:hypothetical protein